LLRGGDSLGNCCKHWKLLRITSPQCRSFQRLQKMCKAESTEGPDTQLTYETCTDNSHQVRAFSSLDNVTTIILGWSTIQPLLSHNNRLSRGTSHYVIVSVATKKTPLRYGLWKKIEITSNSNVAGWPLIIIVY
jgi:hypothetical protein